uniref:Uncharacterized protein n=1 Tax=Arundo donax TaxID=35708 RepID=A0A0A9BDJ2_ARUDO
MFPMFQFSQFNLLKIPCGQKKNLRSRLLVSAPASLIIVTFFSLKDC